MLALQVSIQNGIRQQPQIPPKAAITKQSSHANLPFFFSTRVTIWFPHPGHLHSAGYFFRLIFNKTKYLKG